MHIVRISAAAFLAAVLVDGSASAQHASEPGATCCAQPATKLCVVEPKPTLRTVYSSKDEAYCVPRCNLLSFLLGCCRCEDIPACELRVRSRLVVKKVPGCESKQCVVREIPAPGAGRCEPTQPHWVAPSAPSGAASSTPTRESAVPTKTAGE
jgi:hypothetical protein